MRDSIGSLFLVIAAASSAFSVWGCSGKVAEGEPEKELKVRDDGEPTGDGVTCSWTGATMQGSSSCGEVPIPSGYGPYDLGEDFPSPDGCNECICSARGIMCTVLDCDESGKSPAACQKDGKICADGSTVVREGAGCEFAPCPDEGGVVCTLDVKICEDGSEVGREGPDCEFAPCPGEDSTAPVDSDGSVRGDGCAVACTREAKVCPDGSTVGREGPNCEFAPCPGEGVVCTDDLRQCPDGSWVARSVPNCEFICDEIACTADVKLCADGSYVSRQAPDCQFAPCPYDPCEDKACGAACSVCPPDDSDCGEDLAIPLPQFCSASGKCGHEVAVCR